MGNVVPNTALEFFPQKNSIPAEQKPKKQFYGHIFLYNSGSTGPIV